MKKCLALFLFFFTPLFADGISDISEKEGQSYNYASEFINMLLTLGFVLVLIFATVWILKKIMRSRVQTLNRAGGIKILEKRPLNPKSSLYLVEILGKGIVIAESQAGISVVTEFAESVKVEELLEKVQEEQKVGIIPFKEIFAKKLKKAITKNAG